jgi:hypothetical protein
MASTQNGNTLNGNFAWQLLCYASAVLLLAGEGARRADEVLVGDQF